MIDRAGSRGRTNKIKRRLGIVDRGGSWCWPYKVQGRLSIVDWGGTNRGGNECKLCILICLPFGGPINLNLSLATPGSGSNNSLLLSQPVQLVLVP